MFQYVPGDISIVMPRLSGLRVAIDGIGETIGAEPADRFRTVLHHDHVILIGHLAVAGRRHAVLDFGVGHGRRPGSCRGRRRVAIAVLAAARQHANQRGNGDGDETLLA